MFKAFVTLFLVFFLFSSSTDVNAATKKSKRKISKVVNGRLKNHYSKTNKKKKFKRYAKSKIKNVGGTVDLRALTTDSPYTNSSDNGINSIETKPGIQ